MRWVRDNIRRGSWLALVALAINFALSFGHIHVSAPRDRESALIIAGLGLPDQGKSPDNSGHHADYLCPICIAASTIASGLASAPPTIPLQLNEFVIDRPVQAVRVAVASPRAFFQSRGPPIS